MRSSYHCDRRAAHDGCAFHAQEPGRSRAFPARAHRAPATFMSPAFKNRISRMILLGAIKQKETKTTKFRSVPVEKILVFFVTFCLESLFCDSSAYRHSSIRLLSSLKRVWVANGFPSSFSRLQSHFASLADGRSRRKRRMCMGTNRAETSWPLCGSTSTRYINAR